MAKAVADVWIARHVETEKNQRDVHGRSPLAAPTERGLTQVVSLARDVFQGATQPNAVIAVDTPQAVETAVRVAAEAGVPFEGTIGLAPVRLGIADGISDAELLRINPAVFDELSRFRARVSSARDLVLPGAETAAELAARLLTWWEDGRSQLLGKLVICSNSTALMLAQLLCGTTPLEPEYKCLRFPNGSFRRWAYQDEVWQLVGAPLVRSWPDRSMRYIKSKFGNVAITEHEPSWAPSDVVFCVIPGYFGSSRHGPYGLYNRLARAWAESGHRSVCLDPLGSGDSSDIHRTFETEVESICAVVAECAPASGRLVLVAHSLGVASALEARAVLAADGLTAEVWGLAPLVQQDDLTVAFFGPEQVADLLESRVTYRHGLPLEGSFIEAAQHAWAAHEKSLDVAFFGDADPYIPQNARGRLRGCKVISVSAADHNFSAAGNFEALREESLLLLTQ